MSQRLRYASHPGFKNILPLRHSQASELLKFRFRRSREQL